MWPFKEKIVEVIVEKKVYTGCQDNNSQVCAWTYNGNLYKTEESFEKAKKAHKKSIERDLDHQKAKELMDYMRRVLHSEGFHPLDYGRYDHATYEREKGMKMASEFMVKYWDQCDKLINKRMPIIKISDGVYKVMEEE